MELPSGDVPSHFHKGKLTWIRAKTVTVGGSSQAIPDLPGTMTVSR